MINSDALKKSICLSSLIMLLFSGQNSFGNGNFVSYTPSLSEGSKCIVEVSRLHPTQFSAGYWEIQKRSEKVINKKPAQLLKYLENHVGEIVIGPHGEPYIIDRHHLAVIMSRTGRSPSIYAIVRGNFRLMSVDSFWNVLIERKWAYLYDENGKGPLKPELLPKDINGLRDDPYRSLAWAVRDQGGYSKTSVPFAEFQWADFFRKNLHSSNVNADMQKLISEALKMCHTAEAKNLPGYSGHTVTPVKDQ